MKLQAATEQFLTHCQHARNLSAHSLRAYRADLREFQDFCPNSSHIKQCDREQLKAYLAFLFDQRQLHPSTVKRRMACLNSFFQWLQREVTGTDNPLNGLEVNIKLPARLPRGLSRLEIRQLFRELRQSVGASSRQSLAAQSIIDHSRTRPGYIDLLTWTAAEMLYATGIRVGELCAITLEDLDLAKGVIRIFGKGNRERLVFITDKALLQLLKVYLQARSMRCQDHPYLMVNSQGHRASTNFIRSCLHRSSKRAKLNLNITPHMLRHSVATHLLEEGVDIRFVQQLLGHRSISTTEIYTAVSDTQLQKVICKAHPLNTLA